MTVQREEAEMFERYRVIHFVGIGGIGMSGIAELLHNLGYEVTGSDLRASGTTRRLNGLGIKIAIGHKAENIDDAHVLVLSSAVSHDNPEVREAMGRSIPVIPRAEMLAEIARLKYGILVAGAHGKTTTTSLISTLLAFGGLDPTIVIGGRLKATGSNARLGQGTFLVAEADESDGSFLKLSPTIAVVTNIDREHMDYFKTIESLKGAFLHFINKIPFYGVSIICIENEHVRELIPHIHRRYITYGLSREGELYAENIKQGFTSVSFDVSYKGERIERFELPMPGIHNVLNCLATIGVALVLKMHVSVIKGALIDFHGVQRRFELKGEVRGVRVFDDYGHHPAEIMATLRAAKEGLLFEKQKRRGNRRHTGRLFVLFQPHRYTRTRDLMKEFSASFHDADSLVLLDIYPAGERPINGVNSGALTTRIKKRGIRDALYIKDKADAVDHIVSHIRKGDMLITLGAGDVWKLGEEILKKLRGGN
jgi:UDP-N-acetylmuramate--alanine ligase